MFIKRLVNLTYVNHKIPFKSVFILGQYFTACKQEADIATEQWCRSTKTHGFISKRKLQKYQKFSNAQRPYSIYKIALHFLFSFNFHRKLYIFKNKIVMVHHIPVQEKGRGFVFRNNVWNHSHHVENDFTMKINGHTPIFCVKMNFLNAKIDVLISPTPLFFQTKELKC